MKKWKIFTMAFIALLFVSIVAKGLSLDLKIKFILKQTVANVSGFRGAAVVDVSSGDLLGYYILDTRLASNRQMLAATITNIVRDVRKSGERLGLRPLWFGIALSNGDKLLISFVYSDIFLTTRYDRYSPVGAIKYEIRKATRELKSTL